MFEDADRAPLIESGTCVPTLPHNTTEFQSKPEAPKRSRFGAACFCSQHLHNHRAAPDEGVHAAGWPRKGQVANGARSHVVASPKQSPLPAGVRHRSAPQATPSAMPTTRGLVELPRVSTPEREHGAALPSSCIAFRGARGPTK